MNHTLQKGKLKRWNDDRGFGFICPDDGKRDMFIHISALKRMRRRPVVGDVI
jgi:cold shock CspA family protein